LAKPYLEMYTDGAQPTLFLFQWGGGVGTPQISLREKTAEAHAKIGNIIKHGKAIIDDPWGRPITPPPHEALLQDRQYISDTLTTYPTAEIRERYKLPNRIVGGARQIVTDIIRDITQDLDKTKLEAFFRNMEASTIVTSEVYELGWVSKEKIPPLFIPERQLYCYNVIEDG